MYFIIYKPSDKFTSFTNQIFQTEEAALDYAKRNKFKKTPYKVVEYNKSNLDKYWYK
tara:strand:+ start:37 stop:207 length:171 start_codon:yes stop_codon:yes gene_type:complete